MPVILIENMFVIICLLVSLVVIYCYSRTPLIRPPSESHWCGRIRGMVAREGFVYEQKPLSVTGNVVVREGWSLVRVVVRQGFYCNRILKHVDMYVLRMKHGKYNFIVTCFSNTFQISFYHKLNSVWWILAKKPSF